LSGSLKNPEVAMQRIGESDEFEKVINQLEITSQRLQIAAEKVRNYRQRHGGDCLDLCGGSGMIDVDGVRVRCPLRTFPDKCPIVLREQRRLADEYLREIGLGAFTTPKWPLIEKKLIQKRITPIDTAALLEQMRQEEKGAFLIGPTGIGKTFAMAKMIWSLRYELAQFPFYISSSIRDMSVPYLVKKDWLFWDEFGYITADWYWEKALEIVAARYAEGKLAQTVIATNLTPKQLKEHYAIMRKLADSMVVVNLYRESSK